MSIEEIYDSAVLDNLVEPNLFTKSKKARALHAAGLILLSDTCFDVRVSALRTPKTSYMRKI